MADRTAETMGRTVVMPTFYELAVLNLGAALGGMAVAFGRLFLGEWRALWIGGWLVMSAVAFYYAEGKP